MSKRSSLRKKHITVLSRIKSKHEPKKYTIADLQGIIAEYKTKIKAIGKR